LRGLPNLVHLGNELRDFADTAAVISLLDVVISVDTSVAHLAGALGKSVVILLPHAADFRWMRNRDDTPWYPTAKLFRQPGFGDWDSVIARLGDELRRLS
jgi:ADP-heptose:LPS heptosyltransferase